MWRSVVSTWQGNCRNSSVLATFSVDGGFTHKMKTNETDSMLQQSQDLERKFADLCWSRLLLSQRDSEHNWKNRRNHVDFYCTDSELCVWTSIACQGLGTVQCPCTFVLCRSWSYIRNPSAHSWLWSESVTCRFLLNHLVSKVFSRLLQC